MWQSQRKKLTEKCPAILLAHCMVQFSITALINGVFSSCKQLFYPSLDIILSKTHSGQRTTDEALSSFTSAVRQLIRQRLYVLYNNLTLHIKVAAWCTNHNITLRYYRHSGWLDRGFIWAFSVVSWELSRAFSLSHCIIDFLKCVCTHHTVDKT